MCSCNCKLQDSFKKRFMAQLFLQGRLMIECFETFRGPSLVCGAVDAVVHQTLVKASVVDAQ